jgi:tripeptide aminopeptidase
MDDALVNHVLDLAVEIQQIPAPTFNEAERAAAVYRHFMNEELIDVQIDSHSNVYARLPSTGAEAPLVVSAHLDTVFAAETSLAIDRQPGRIAGPGIGDNSLAVAALFGLLWNLHTTGTQLPGDLWLVANVCEEGLGNLLGMQAVVDRFENTPRAYIILEGMAFGQIYHRALGSARFRVSVKTAGGHSWVDFGKPSAIHELVYFANRLLALPVPQIPRTSLNVGTIRGGVSVNTIAGQAELELDLRSEDAQTLEALIAQVLALAEQARRDDVNISIDLIGRRPVGDLSRDHPLVELAARCLQVQGVEPKFNIGSTDANIPLSRGYPAICVGITNGGGAHTPQEFILTDPINRGLAQVTALVEGVFNLPR